jgi:hypothetical protein
MIEERGPLAGLTVSEILLVAWRLSGPDMVVETIKGAALGRETLKRAVREYRALGLHVLGDLVQGFIKCAPPGPLSFEQRRAAQIRHKKRRLAPGP